MGIKIADFCVKPIDLFLIQHIFLSSSLNLSPEQINFLLTLEFYFV